MGYGGDAVRLFATFVCCTGIACALLASCGTVDPGPDVQPPAGCNAPPAFFVTDIWPKYFATYSCGQSDCHDQNTGHGFFRLQDVSSVMAPDPASPTSTWPTQWQFNFMSVQSNVSCNDPLNSLVLIVPSGLGTPHPAGDVVTDQPAADALFSTWLGMQ